MSARPLHNEDAEQAVLSAMMIDEAAAQLAVRTLAAPMFFGERHRRLFAAMAQVIETGAVVDPVTLANTLAARLELDRAGGKDYIGFLVDAVPTSANVGYHAAIVRDLAQLRGLLAALDGAAGRIRQGETTRSPADIAREAFAALLPYTIEDDVAGEGFQSVRETLWATMERIEARAEGETGILTGYGQIDRQTGGMFDGELLILGGAEGMGKSAAALNLALKISQRPASEGGGSCAIVSAEMTRDAVQRFCLSWLSGVDGRTLRSGALRDDDFPRLARAAGVLAGLPLWISDQAEPSVTDVISRCTHLKAQHPGLRVVVVDFLQLIHAREKGLNEAIELKRVAYALKAMAKRLKLLVIAPCQINTKDVEDLKDPRPRLKDLQGSSGMRQAADFVALLYRPGYYNPMAEAREMEWNFAKVREAAPFLARMTWNGATRRIDEWRTA